METTKTFKFLFLIFFGMILMNFTCNDCEDELHDRSNFTVILNSSQNTISIGDTLSLNTALNSLMELEFSGRIHDNSNKAINYRIEVFEARANSNDAFPARDNFELIGQVGNVNLPPFRIWEVIIENNCGEDTCELELGIIPLKVGYFGIALRTGNFGIENECEHLSLFPNGIQSNGNNNFEIFEEINISSIRVNKSIFSNPESEKLLYFFKVIE